MSAVKYIDGDTPVWEVKPGEHVDMYAPVEVRIANAESVYTDGSICPVCGQDLHAIWTYSVQGNARALACLVGAHVEIPAYTDSCGIVSFVVDAGTRALLGVSVERWMVPR